MQQVSVVVCDANCGREGKSANARWRCLAAAAATGGRRPFIKLCFSTITAALLALYDTKPLQMCNKVQKDAGRQLLAGCLAGEPYIRFSKGCQALNVCVRDPFQSSSFNISFFDPIASPSSYPCQIWR